MLTPEQQKQAVAEFKTLYELQYGVELSDEQATELAKTLLEAFSFSQ